MSGSVRCGRVQRAVAHPRLPNYTVCPVWSRGAGDMKQLSPMLLRNVIIIEPLEAKLRPGYSISPCELMQVADVSCFENYWQGSKIYLVDLIDAAAPITVDNLRPGFWMRRAAIYASVAPIRRALPKAKYGTPIAGYYRGQIMSYVQSRISIYIPLYCELVEKHPVFLELLRLHRCGKNLLLIGPDGYDPSVELTCELLGQLQLRDDMIYGHELVLCQMLL